MIMMIDDFLSSSGKLNAYSEQEHFHITWILNPALNMTETLNRIFNMLEDMLLYSDTLFWLFWLPGGLVVALTPKYRLLSVEPTISKDLIFLYGSTGGRTNDLLYSIPACYLDTIDVVLQIRQQKIIWVEFINNT